MVVKTKRLSIVDQTLCRHYVRVCLCFPFSSSGDQVTATRQIKTGLLATLRQAPYLAGSIRFDPSCPSSRAVLLTYPDTVDDINEPVFSVKRHESPEDAVYDDLVEKGVHPAQLLGSDFGPGLPDSPDLNVPSPPLGVCVNFIRGGLIITIYSQHSVIDGRGLGYFIDDFASNVRAAGVADVAEERKRFWGPLDCLWRILDYWTGRSRPQANDKHGRIRVEGDDSARDLLTRSSSNLSTSISKPTCPEFTPIDHTSPPLACNITKPDTKAHIFVLDTSSLRRLRDRIASFWHDADDSSRGCLKEKIPVFEDLVVSTWDAIAALIWIYVTRARFRKRPLLSPMVKFGFTIDCRRRLPVSLPERFMGNAALYTYAEFPTSEFTDPTDVPFEVIAKAALHIRFANIHFGKTAVQDRLAYLSQLPTQDTPGNAIRSTFGPDVFMTSWQEMGSNANFGIHGTMDDTLEGLRSHEPGMPTFMRKPGCAPTDGGIILLPRRKLSKVQDDAPFEVMVQLRGDHMECLLGEEGFMEHVQRVIV